MELDQRILWAVMILVLGGIIAYMAWPEPEPPPEPEPEPEPEELGPCEQIPDELDADYLGGPFDTFEAMCGRWEPTGECERIEMAESDNFLPFEDAAFVRRPVPEEEEDDKVAIGFAVMYAGKWWLRPEVSRRYEDHAEHEIRHREREEAAPILELDTLFERRFYHGDTPESPVQVISRKTLLLCSVGESEKPSCSEVPQSWRRETRRPDQPPDDVAESIIAHTWCDNGNIIIEGTTERLSRDNVEWVQRLLGLNVPVFP